jgi:hypothetical protein
VRRFLEDDLYFDPFSEGQSVLPGERAYSHLNALGSYFRDEEFRALSPAAKGECQG